MTRLTEHPRHCPWLAMRLPRDGRLEGPVPLLLTIVENPMGLVKGVQTAEGSRGGVPADHRGRQSRGGGLAGGL